MASKKPVCQAQAAKPPVVVVEFQTQIWWYMSPPFSPSSARAIQCHDIWSWESCRRNTIRLSLSSCAFRILPCLLGGICQRLSTGRRWQACGRCALEMREDSRVNCNVNLHCAIFCKTRGFFARLAGVQICWQAIWTSAFHAWETGQIVKDGTKMLQCRSMRSCSSPYFLFLSGWMQEQKLIGQMSIASSIQRKAGQGNSNCVGLEAFDGFFLVALSLLSRCQWAAANFPGQMGLSTVQQGTL